MLSRVAERPADATPMLLHAADTSTVCRKIEALAEVVQTEGTASSTGALDRAAVATRYIGAVLISLLAPFPLSHQCEA